MNALVVIIFLYFARCGFSPSLSSLAVALSLSLSFLTLPPTAYFVPPLSPLFFSPDLLASFSIVHGLSFLLHILTQLSLSTLNNGSRGRCVCASAGRGHEHWYEGGIGVPVCARYGEDGEDRRCSEGTC